MYILIVCAVCLFVSGCRDIALQQTPPVRLLDCPPSPVPECHPSRWEGDSLDTTTVPPHRDQQHWWRIRTVRGANGPTQEYALCFFDSRRGWLTHGTTAVQHATPILMAATDSLIITGKDILLDGFRSIGTFTTDGRTILAGGLPDGSRRARVVLLHGIRTDSVHARGTSLLIGQNEWTSHPALSSDGTLLIVASNRDGGYGGLDLWYSIRRSDGTWDSLRNLGPTLNTPCDELSPFIASDGTLLFASNGHASMGGYDLFAARLVRSNSAVIPGAVENLRPPINTSADEIFPSTSGDWRRLLYWSSNRRDRNFDLYVAERLERPKAPPPAITSEEKTDEVTPRARIRGRVRTADKHPVRNADISVHDIERRRTVAQTQTDTIGTFEVIVPTERELEITAQSESGFYDTRRIRIRREDTAVTIAEDFTIPAVLTLRINFPHDQARVPYEFVLDSNGMQTDHRWSDELDRVAENILRYRDRIKRIVLVGHTDPNGTDAYNLDLGRRRVEFVIEELVKRGVPQSLLEGTSAGERQLLPRRAGEPTNQYYRRNRRVELSKVLQ
ncbi:MAG: OmpA family protein [Chlorobi bacterium]|nr:OmpA family protein [Chlorobiota bacterium]